MKSKVVIAAAVLAVLLAAAAVYAHGGVPHAAKKQTGTYDKWAKWQNATIYATTRQLTLTGDGISAALKVDILTRNATSTYGRIIYGSGEVKLGDATYTAKAVYGVVGPNGARITIYTGTEIVTIRYKDGQYTAVVKTLGQPGYKTYSGSAQLTIS